MSAPKLTAAQRRALHKVLHRSGRTWLEWHDDVRLEFEALERAGLLECTVQGDLYFITPAGRAALEGAS